MKAKYIDKTFPITLQDLIDLAKSENKDPKDLKLIMNEHDPNYTGYAQCAVLNQDCDKISIELYQANGYHQPNKQKSKPHLNEYLPRFDNAYHILDSIKDLTDTELHIVSDIDIKLLGDALVILQAFIQKQTNNKNK